jgi:hypothetical protein
VMRFRRSVNPDHQVVVDLHALHVSYDEPTSHVHGWPFSQPWCWVSELMLQMRCCCC